MMNAKDRRKQILKLLSETGEPLSGSALAGKTGVSRQVIVQDIALLRVEGHEILSTNYGYILPSSGPASRVFKVRHTDEEMTDELSLIVDLGGIVKDVFVYHKVYGVLRADINIRSRRDIQNFQQDISSGKSSLLMHVTSGYHYHTIIAQSGEILDEIREALDKAGYLAPLQDYEPVDFGSGEPKA